jgi:hypothetical protein
MQATLSDRSQTVAANKSTLASVKECMPLEPERRFHHAREIARRYQAKLLDLRAPLLHL